MAIHRLRLIIATLAALLVPAALAGPALAAHIRVEGKSHSIFQGNARPFVGTLRGHTTTKQTALGSLVTASRMQPFALGLTWSDCCGGAWKGFFVSSIDHVRWYMPFRLVMNMPSRKSVRPLICFTFAWS